MSKTREQSILKTLEGVWNETNDGTNKNFCAIFGKAAGDGNVWNVLRRKGIVKENEEFKYIWHGPPPDEEMAIIILSEATAYIEHKKDLRMAARKAVVDLKTNIEEVGRELIKIGADKDLVEKLREAYRNASIITEYMKKNSRKPNLEYEGVGSVPALKNH